MTKLNIILIHKKGFKGNLDNYSLISLISNIYTIFQKIIISRKSIPLDENQHKEQVSYRGKFLTIDQIQVLKQVLKKYKEYNKVYNVAFVDFNNALNISLMHLAGTESQGGEIEYIRTLINIYLKSTTQVKLDRNGAECPTERSVYKYLDNKTRSDIEANCLKSKVNVS